MCEKALQSSESNHKTTGEEGPLHFTERVGSVSGLKIQPAVFQKPPSHFPRERKHFHSTKSLVILPSHFPLSLDWRLEKKVSFKQPQMHYGKYTLFSSPPSPLGGWGAPYIPISLFPLWPWEAS